MVSAGCRFAMGWYASYTAALKLKAIECAIEPSNNAGPKTGKFPQTEAPLLDYAKALCEGGCAASMEVLCNHVHVIVRKEGLLAQDFRASNGWAPRSMRRNRGLSPVRDQDSTGKFADWEHGPKRALISRAAISRWLIDTRRFSHCRRVPASD